MVRVQGEAGKAVAIPCGAVHLSDSDFRMNDLFTDLPTALPKEFVEVFAENRHIRIGRITSTGHAIPEGLW